MLWYTWHTHSEWNAFCDCVHLPEFYHNKRHIMIKGVNANSKEGAVSMNSKVYKIHKKPSVQGLLMGWYNNHYRLEIDWNGNDFRGNNFHCVTHFLHFKIVHLNSNILTCSKQIRWINSMLVFFRFNPTMQQSVFYFNCSLKYIHTTKLAELCTVYLYWRAHTLFRKKKKNEKKRYCFRCFIRFYLFIECEGKTLAIVSTALLCAHT